MTKGNYKRKHLFGIQKPRGLEPVTIRLRSTAAGTGHDIGASAESSCIETQSLDRVS